jgi:outer membrane immunogenic protein
VFRLPRPVAIIRKTGTHKMNLFSRIAGLTLTSLAALTAANAADMYRCPGCTARDTFYGPAVWTGFYLGANGGYGWSAYNDKYSYPAGVDAFGPYSAYGGNHADGGFGGAQLGYNWQMASPFVIGFETDIQGAGISGSGTDGVDNFKTQLNWFGTVRGRVGYAFDHALVYFTGGYAYGGLQSTISVADSFNFDNTVSGYVLGGGAEYKFNPAWSVKVEYQYLDFGKNEPTRIDGLTATGWGVNTPDDAFHTVRVGINYYVMPGIEPLK